MMYAGGPSAQGSPIFGPRVSHGVKVGTPASRLKRLFQPLEASRRF